MTPRLSTGLCCAALAALGAVACRSQPDPAPAPQKPKVAAPVEAMQALGQAIGAKDWERAASYLSEEWLRDVSPGDPKVEGYWRFVVADTAATDTRWVWYPLGPETVVSDPTPTKDGVVVRLENKDLGAFDDARPGFLLLRPSGERWLLYAAYDKAWKPGD